MKYVKKVIPEPKMPSPMTYPKTSNTTDEYYFYDSYALMHLSALLTVVRAGMTYPDPHFIVSRGKGLHSGITVEYVISGKGYVRRNDGREYPVGAGDFYFLNQNIPCTYYADKDAPFQKIWVHLAGRFIYAMSYAFSLDEPVITGHSEIVGEAIRRMCDILKKLRPEDVPDHYDELTDLTLQMFRQVAECRESEPENRWRTVVDIGSIERFIDENVTNGLLTAQWVANAFFISRMTLYRLFKRERGISPQEYIQRAKVFYAEELLRYGTWRLEQVAKTLRYKDTRTFSAAFKKVTGISPTEWKRRNLPEKNPKNQRGTPAKIKGEKS